MNFRNIKNARINLIKIALITIPLVASVSSCKKDFLEAVPELSLSDANAFDTPERIAAQVNGLYFTAKAGSFLGGRYQVYNDIRAEEFINRTSNNVTGYNVFQGTQNASDTYIGNMWIQGYLTINRINLFLEGLEANSSKISPALYANYKGEAKFLRGLCYFSLVQIFAKPYSLDAGASKGLPLRLTPETGTANNGMPRSTVAQVYTQILKDLNESETELPETYATPLLRTTRAHKNTAIALKTRVLLAKGDYAGVITEGNKLVSAAAPFTTPVATNAQHALQANVVNVFRAPYTTSESILSFPMADTNAPGTQNQIGSYFNFGNVEFYMNRAAPGILANAQFSATDVRRTGLTGPYQTNMTVSTKFSGVSPYIDFVPVIRYAEVLLNLAEAEAVAGSPVRAAALLGAVHSRSDVAVNFGALTPGALLTAILTERRIELLAEGFRANDLLRRGDPIPAVGAGGSIASSDPRYVFPIPLSETNSNPDL
ncbi:RagB/SusD family nutrient uptake outer membrane protein [Flavihumibacter sp. R14]|nr:RagB/SusD family nutrient uptake outer membrane protein [Flavihumibacter soli]